MSSKSNEKVNHIDKVNMFVDTLTRFDPLNELISNELISILIQILNIRIIRRYV